MPRKSQRPKLELDATQREKLQKISQSRTAPIREVHRATILLKYADGKKISDIEKELGVRRPSIYKCIDKALAAACGLFCGACNAYIATTEDPKRLTELAALFGLAEAAIRCEGCRSSVKGPYCSVCKMAACTAERGIDFCVECEAYPCEDLKQFQAEAPHRLDLWGNLSRIGEVGWSQWIRDVRETYRCASCGTINSAYDAACRACGEAPSCPFVSRHGKEIARFLEGKAPT